MGHFSISPHFFGFLAPPDKFHLDCNPQAGLPVRRLLRLPLRPPDPRARGGGLDQHGRRGRLRRRRGFRSFDSRLRLAPSPSLADPHCLLLGC